MQNISQGGAAAARLAHDQQAGSSILPPATINHSGQHANGKRRTQRISKQSIGKHPVETQRAYRQ